MNMNTHESYAWFRFAATGMAFAYLSWRLFFADADVGHATWDETRGIMSILLQAFVLVMVILTRPGKGVVADERDRAISASAAKAALIALSLIVLVSAMVVGTKGHADLLTSRPGGWFEHYLIACLALAWWVESAVCVFHHRRDRR